MLFLNGSYLSHVQFVAIILAGTTGKIHLMGLSCGYPSSDTSTPNHSRPQRETAGRLTPVLTGPPRNTQVTLGDSNRRLRSNTLLGDNWAIICSTISVTGRMVSIFVAGIAM